MALNVVKLLSATYKIRLIPCVKYSVTFLPQSIQSKVLQQHNLNFKQHGNELISILLQNKTINRHKHFDKKKTNKEDSDSEDEEEEQFLDEKDSKVIKTTVNSLRTDLLLKAGLSMARNKVETMFYESKIRVNGQKVLKKSTHLNVGDEIDLIKGASPANPQHLLVGRVIILAVEPKGDGLSVKLRRYKSLLIENYNEPWKPIAE